MRRACGGTNLALSEAVDRLRDLHLEIPERCRPDLFGERWADLEGEIDRCCGAGNAEAALRAIALWEEHMRRVLVGVLAQAPLEVSL